MCHPTALVRADVFPDFADFPNTAVRRRTRHGLGGESPGNDAKLPIHYLQLHKPRTPQRHSEEFRKRLFSELFGTTSELFGIARTHPDLIGTVRICSELLGANKSCNTCTQKWALCNALLPCEGPRHFTTDIPDQTSEGSGSQVKDLGRNRPYTKFTHFEQGSYEVG